jgi:periplasmic divalent cation tolerance protein
MSNVRLVFVTLPNETAALTLTRTLVGEHLVACGNLIPGVHSIYRWQGEVCEEAEILVLFKTTVDGFVAAKQRIVELHPYACPEVLGVDVADGHDDYLSWVSGQVRH